MTARITIGDLVSYGGRSWYLLGLEPMSVPERRVDLEDVRTGEHVTVPLTDVQRAPPRRLRKNA